MNSVTASPNIIISSVSHFVPQQSDTEVGRFVFSYTITIENKSESSYQLISRHWLIQDGNMKIEEVYGDGVVGEQPIIEAGGSYAYTSGAILETDIGTMEGHYFFETKCPQGNPSSEFNVRDRSKIEVSIPKFLLTIPRTVH